MCILEMYIVACELRLSLEGGQPPQFTASAVTLFLVGQWAQDKLQSDWPCACCDFTVSLSLFLFELPARRAVSQSCQLDSQGWGSGYVTWQLSSDGLSLFIFAVFFFSFKLTNVCQDTEGLIHNGSCYESLSHKQQQVNLSKSVQLLFVQIEANKII